jgi:hypothetical protein
MMLLKVKIAITERRIRFSAPPIAMTLKKLIDSDFTKRVFAQQDRFGCERRSYAL